MRPVSRYPGGIGGIVDLMPIRQRADPTPDLFASPPPGANAPERSPIPKGGSEPGNSLTRSRPLLPTDLAASLQRLGDPEVDALLAAVTASWAASLLIRLSAHSRNHLPIGTTGLDASCSIVVPIGGPQVSMTEQITGNQHLRGP
jgi:hypothetical protein